MTAQDIERAASAAYSAHNRLIPSAPQWPDLPDHRKHHWRLVAGAALGAAPRLGPTGPVMTMRERLLAKRAAEGERA